MTVPAEDAPQPRSPDLPATAERPRGRPRCESIDSNRSRDGGRDIRVHLSWPDESRTHGYASSVGLPEAEIRAAAEATLDALLAHGSTTPAFRLRGARAVRAFDHIVVIVAVDRDSHSGTPPLVGSVATSRSERIRGSVLATLDAVNRLMELGSSSKPRPE